MVTLDEEGFVEAEIKLGAFPGHQKVRRKLSWFITLSFKNKVIQDMKTISCYAVWKLLPNYVNTCKTWGYKQYMKYYLKN